MRLLVGALCLGLSHGGTVVPQAESKASVEARLHLIAVCPEVTAKCGVPKTEKATIPELAAALDCMLKVDVDAVDEGPCHEALELFLHQHDINYGRAPFPPRPVPPPPRAPPAMWQRPIQISPISTAQMHNDDRRPPMPFMLFKREDKDENRRPPMPPMPFMPFKRDGDKDADRRPPWMRDDDDDDDHRRSALPFSPWIYKRESDKRESDKDERRSPMPFSPWHKRDNDDDDDDRRPSWMHRREQDDEDDDEQRPWWLHKRDSDNGRRRGHEERDTRRRPQHRSKHHERRGKEHRGVIPHRGREQHKSSRGHSYRSHSYKPSFRPSFSSHWQRPFPSRMPSHFPMPQHTYDQRMPYGGFQYGGHPMSFPQSYDQRMSHFSPRMSQSPMFSRMPQSPMFSRMPQFPRPPMFSQHFQPSFQQPFQRPTMVMLMRNTQAQMAPGANDASDYDYDYDYDDSDDEEDEQSAAFSHILSIMRQMASRASDDDDDEPDVEISPIGLASSPLLYSESEKPTEAPVVPKPTEVVKEAPKV